MAFIFFNPNPSNQRVGDCTIRALCKALDKEWETAYIETACEGLKLHDMPSANHVWGSLLRKYGYEQRAMPSLCPDCTTVNKFTLEHPKGKYVLSCESHVVTAENGDFFDTWNSGEEVVLYYWQKGE